MDRLPRSHLTDGDRTPRGANVAVDLQDLSRRLFKAADQLWANSTLRPDQYAQPVLALIALRQMEARFELAHAELAPRFTGA
jgi:type I restriction enzyme M protein